MNQTQRPTIRERVARYWPRTKAERAHFDYLRNRSPGDRDALAAQVAADLVPRRFYAQRVVVAAILGHLMLAKASNGYHVEVGRDALVRETGADRKTVSAAMARLRGPLVYNPVHGRKGVGCSIYTMSVDLLGMLADKAQTLGRGRRAAGLAALSRKRSRSQGGMSGTKDSPLTSAVVAGRPPSPPPPARPPSRACDHGTTRHGCSSDPDRDATLAEVAGIRDAQNAIRAILDARKASRTARYRA